MTTAGPVPSAGQPVGSRAGRFRDHLRPVWHAAFRDPIRDGHVRLSGLSVPERQVARIGLVTLGGLLLSVLLADRWRGGELLPVGDGATLVFLPQGLLAVTVTAFYVAWLLILWGALDGARWVRILAALGFLLVNALMIPSEFGLGEGWIVDHGRRLIVISYFTTVGLVLASAALPRPPARVARPATAVLRGLVVVSLGGFFFTQLAVHASEVEQGFGQLMPQQLSVTLTDIENVLMPLVYVAAVLVIDFSLNLANGVARSVREVPAAAVRWLLLALVAVKLWFVLLDELGDWATFVRDRPDAVVRTTVSMAVLALAVWWVGRRPETDATERAREGLMYGAAVLITAPVFGFVLVTGAASVVWVVSGEFPGWHADYPANTVVTWGQPLAAGGAVLAGLWLLRNERGHPLRYEVGTGMVVIGAWVLPVLLINLVGWEIGFSAELLDVLVTVAVLVGLALAWRRLDGRRAALLAGVTVFSWLAMTEGDWISLLGSMLGLAAVLVVVVGVLFSVLGDAGFTRRTGASMPPSARVLVFVGYLVLSVTILHWVQATHAASPAGLMSGAAFYAIALPWSAWTIGRRLV